MMKFAGVGYVLAFITGAMTMHVLTIEDYDNESQYYYRSNGGSNGGIDLSGNTGDGGGGGVINNDGGDGDALQRSLLPSKFYTIVGLESSGTTFVSNIIGNALKLDKHFTPGGHEGIAVGMTPGTALADNKDNKKDRYHFTEVQHVSLPWGMGCAAEPLAWKNVVKVIYPWVCMRISRFPRSKWRKKAKQLWHRCQTELMGGGGDTDETTTKPLRKRQQQQDYQERQQLQQYREQQQQEHSIVPPRYFLNISSHFDWYKQRGVDIHLIIVVRDAFIGRVARSEHCGDPELAEKEEETGMNIIEEAIQRYIVTNHHRVGGSSTNITTGVGSHHHHHHHTGIMASRDNKVIVVSYELLNRFRKDYLQVLYDTLGIRSNYVPIWSDGNTKYVEGKE